jgi:aspartate/methionine/tyrosine aminotransferase
MPVSRLKGIAPIGVDRMGNLADKAADGSILRLENLDTDIQPPAGVVEATQKSAGEDHANSYLPFFGADAVRQGAASLVSRMSGVDYDWNTTTIVSAGGLNGILNVLLALLEPGDEVIMPDPIYIGLINRVLLAGGTPVFVSYDPKDGGWVFNPDNLRAAITPRTKMFLMMSPAMPTGAVFSRADWEAICAACRDAGAWMLVDTAMERILFGGAPHVHPASFPGMAERTISVGALSKEYRMIGWRVGWIVAPPELIDDIGLVNISNVVCPVGIAQDAAALALQTPDAELAHIAAELQRRRDVILSELSDYPVIKPMGGWSLLMDCAPLGLTGEEASNRLLEHGKIAATAMTGWGTPRSGDYLRFVFSNEPTDRLTGIRARVDAALRK